MWTQKGTLYIVQKLSKVTHLGQCLTRELHTQNTKHHHHVVQGEQEANMADIWRTENFVVTICVLVVIAQCSGSDSLGNDSTTSPTQPTDVTMTATLSWTAEFDLNSTSTANTDVASALRGETNVPTTSSIETSTSPTKTAVNTASMTMITNATSPTEANVSAPSTTITTSNTMPQAVTCDFTSSSTEPEVAITSTTKGEATSVSFTNIATTSRTQTDVTTTSQAQTDVTTTSRTQTDVTTTSQAQTDVTTTSQALTEVTTMPPTETTVILASSTETGVIATSLFETDIPTTTELHTGPSLATLTTEVTTQQTATTETTVNLTSSTITAHSTPQTTTTLTIPPTTATKTGLTTISTIITPTTTPTVTPTTSSPTSITTTPPPSTTTPSTTPKVTPTTPSTPQTITPTPTTATATATTTQAAAAILTTSETRSIASSTTDLTTDFNNPITTNTRTTQKENGDSNSSRTSVPAVAGGGAAAGVVVVAVIVSLIFCERRRNAKQDPNARISAKDADGNDLESFLNRTYMNANVTRLNPKLGTVPQSSSLQSGARRNNQHLQNADQHPASDAGRSAGGHLTVPAETVRSRLMRLFAEAVDEGSRSPSLANSRGHVDRNNRVGSTHSEYNLTSYVSTSSPPYDVSNTSLIPDHDDNDYAIVSKVLGGWGGRHLTSDHPHGDRSTSSGQNAKEQMQKPVPAPKPHAGKRTTVHYENLSSPTVAGPVLARHLPVRQPATNRYEDDIYNRLDYTPQRQASRGPEPLYSHLGFR